MPTLVCIVEGQGDVQSIPVILRRIAAQADVYDLSIRPIRIARSKLVRQGEVERAIELGAREAAPRGAVLIVVDADDDAACQLGPELLRRAQGARPDIASAVVLANREKEAWYIAAVESLRSRRGLGEEVARPRNPEGIRNAKAWLAQRMTGGRYSEVSDQAAFAAMFDFDAARQYAPSFAKFERDCRRLLGR